MTPIFEIEGYRVFGHYKAGVWQSGEYQIQREITKKVKDGILYNPPVNDMLQMSCNTILVSALKGILL